MVVEVVIFAFGEEWVLQAHMVWMSACTRPHMCVLPGGGIKLLTPMVDLLRT